MKLQPHSIEYEKEPFIKLLPKTRLLRWINSVLRELDKTDYFISAYFTTNETIQELNHTYRNKNMATDVLSFSQIEGEEFEFNNSFLGDIVIAVPYAESQAKKLGHNLENEVYYLILHGILHLLGYDHDENEDGQMNAIEKEIFYKLTKEELE